MVRSFCAVGANDSTFNINWRIQGTFLPKTERHERVKTLCDGEYFLKLDILRYVLTTVVSDEFEIRNAKYFEVQLLSLFSKC